jgi:hypothetical protein
VTHVDEEALSGFSYDYDEEEDDKKEAAMKDEKKGLERVRLELRHLK